MENNYWRLFENIPAMGMRTIGDHIVFVSRNCQLVSGFSSEDLTGDWAALWLARVHPKDAPGVVQDYAKLTTERLPFDREYRWQRRDGRWIWLHHRAVASLEHSGDVSVDGLLCDVTEKKDLERQISQAQKMESIALLTGGIAHDFNNILAAIVGNAHFIIDGLAEGDPRRVDAEEIKRNAERAAALTRQLLAFGRRKMLEPSVLDLNAIVAGLEHMLRRTIGEDIELGVHPAQDLGCVLADAGQLEQVLLNLVLNARDAMQNGGTLTVETANVVLDRPYTDGRACVEPGRYVMLAIRDTGCGMDAETQSRLFEPFFSTKELGKGTGLGLSTCYGIVKQSHGYILVDSEPDRGSVFKVYLPRVDDVPHVCTQTAARKNLRGSETILVIEDDDDVRATVRRVLTNRGYRVFAARNGEEALKLSGTHRERIQLVLSDVIMPGLSGPEIVRQVRQCSARTKALFMSGYSDRAIQAHSAPPSGISFIQKPFAPDALAMRVREVLDA
jgi:PAS domain S-box-containing protein